MTFEDIKSTLKRLFNRLITTSIHSATIVKQEEAFYCKSKLKKKKKLLTSQNKNKNSKCNPLNKHGQISEILMCIRQINVHIKMKDLDWL